MTTYTVTSNDTLVLNDRVFNDLATGDVTKITFPNDLVNLKTGKKKNTIFAQNTTGQNGLLVLRLARGSSDDQWMQSQQQASLTDFPSTVLLNGRLVKRLGDGAGNVINDVYQLGGGVISKQVEGGENVEGNTDQAESIYNVKFALAGRSIQ